MKNGAAAIENSMAVSQKKIKNRMTNLIQLFHFPTSQYVSERIANRIAERYLHTHCHGSTIHNSREVEGTQETINR